jgi:hypothetical protein
MAAACLMAGCGGGGSDRTTDEGTPTETLQPVLRTKVKGKIVDQDGEKVAGASVIDGNKTVTSDENGEYELFVSTRSKFVVLVVKKDGYATNAKQLPVATDVPASLDIKLFKDDFSTTFTSASGGTFTTGNAVVKIEPNSIKTAEGMPYSGTVSITVNYFNPDTDKGVEGFPEPYAGLDDGQESILRSVGVIEVKLLDAVRRPLQLDPAKPATLTYPATSAADGASSIPLWHYDEAKRIWVREGEATVQGDGTYRGTVKHFTLWNADIPSLVSEGTRIKGCTKNTDGKPAAYVRVTVRGSGLRLKGLTDGDGTFETYVPSGIPLRINYNVGIEIEVPPLTPGEVRQLNCQVMSPVMQFAGSYEGKYNGSDEGEFVVGISNEGVVTGTGTSTALASNFVITGSVEADGGLLMSGSAAGASYRGTIDVATGTLSGTWTADGASGSFSGGKKR